MTYVYWYTYYLYLYILYLLVDSRVTNDEKHHTVVIEYENSVYYEWIEQDSDLIRIQFDRVKGTFEIPKVMSRF